MGEPNHRGRCGSRGDHGEEVMGENGVFLPGSFPCILSSNRAVSGSGGAFFLNLTRSAVGLRGGGDGVVTGTAPQYHC